jgi:L-galactose dehydrogenase
MRYRSFGNAGWQVSEVSLGGAYLCGQDAGRAEENATAIVTHAAQLGINYIDTAPAYGRSEELLGAALAAVSHRFHVATKIGIEPRDFDYRRDAVLWSIERSLRRLRLGKLALIQVHEVNLPGWERIMAPGQALDGLRAAQQQGLVERIGITGRAIPLLTRLIETGEFDAVLVYHDYHPGAQRAAESVIPAAAAKHMGIVVATVLAGGLFGHADGIAQALARQPEAERPRLQRVIDRLHREPGTLAQLAFRYVLSDARVSTVASGAATVAELEEVAQASDLGPVGNTLVDELREL